MATSHSKVKGWPGDRVPGLDDAEFAHRPLDATTINSVLESIRVTQNPAQTTRYLQPGQDNPLQPARNETPSVQWPSCLVSVLDSELEAEIATIDIPKLVSICYHQFIPRVPFLRDLPSRTAFEQPKSVYVNLAMASIGGIIAKEPISKCVSLWRSAIRLIIWQLEVDNREARKIDLISAWMFMETFGHLTSDSTIWRHTSMAHGYVEAAVWRLAGDPTQFGPEAQDQAANLAIKRGLVSYTLMIDLLRAIHFGQSITIITSSSLVDFTRVRKDGSRKDDQPETDLLQTLLAILARIHAVATVLEPIVGEPSPSFLTPRQPPIAFSGKAELDRVKLQLEKDLDQWKEKWIDLAERDVVTLFHFCRLYQSFPELQNLVNISGYAPRGSKRDNKAESKLMAAIRYRKNAVNYAWDVLNAVTGQNSLENASVWIPMALFYASLVVWASIKADSTGKSPGSVNILKIFQSSLQAVGMPCCEEMSRALGELLRRDSFSEGNTSSSALYRG